MTSEQISRAAAATAQLTVALDAAAVAIMHAAIGWPLCPGGRLRYRAVRGRIGKPVDKARAGLRKSQRRTRQQKRQAFNRWLRVEYGIRNRSPLNSAIRDLVYAWVKDKVIHMAKQLQIEPPDFDRSPPSCPNLARKAQEILLGAAQVRQ